MERFVLQCSTFACTVWSSLLWLLVFCYLVLCYFGNIHWGSCTAVGWLRNDRFEEERWVDFFQNCTLQWKQLPFPECYAVLYNFRNTSQQTPAAVSYEEVVNWAYVKKAQYDDVDRMHVAQCGVKDGLFWIQ